MSAIDKTTNSQYQTCTDHIAHSLPTEVFAFDDNEA